MTISNTPDLFVDYADFDAIRFPDNSTRFLVGDQLNNAAGWNMGRVMVFSNQIVDNVENNLTTGRHRVEWNASELSSGIYFYRFESGNAVKQRKMILLK